MSDLELERILDDIEKKKKQGKIASPSDLPNQATSQISQSKETDVVNEGIGYETRIERDGK